MEGKISGQGWARFGLAFGAALSITGNVAHTVLEGSSISLGLRVPFAVAWPIALFIGIEILVRIDWRRKWTDHIGRMLLWGPTGAVAAVVSYLHLHSLMILAGEDSFSSRIGPLAVDGLMIGSTVALLAIRARLLAEQPQPESKIVDLEETSATSTIKEQLAALPVNEEGDAYVAELIRAEQDSSRDSITEHAERVVRQRAPKPTEESKAKAARMLAEGRLLTEVEASVPEVPATTLRRFQTAARKLRDNPSADLGKVPGVSSDLIEIMRKEARKP